jgi:hypothetical protein
VSSERHKRRGNDSCGLTGRGLSTLGGELEAKLRERYDALDFAFLICVRTIFFVFFNFLRFRSPAWFAPMIFSP